MTEQVKDTPISNVAESDQRVDQSNKDPVQPPSSDASYLEDLSTILRNNQATAANGSFESNPVNVACDERHKDGNTSDDSQPSSVPLDGNVIRETMKSLNAHGYRDDVNSSANSDDNSDSSDSDSSSTVSEDNDESDNTSLR